MRYTERQLEFLTSEVMLWVEQVSRFNRYAGQDFLDRVNSIEGSLFDRMTSLCSVMDDMIEWSYACQV